MWYIKKNSYLYKMYMKYKYTKINKMIHIKI